MKVYRSIKYLLNCLARVYEKIMELLDLELKCVRKLARTPKAKAIIYHILTLRLRRHGYRMGLETPVVHAINDER